MKKKFKKSVVFGVFIGVPYGRFTSFQLEPARIELYKESFEQYFHDPEKPAKRSYTRSAIIPAFPKKNSGRGGIDHG